MFTYEKSNSIGQLSVLAGLWLVNILILVFGLPFLLFKKLQEIFAKPAKKPQSDIAEKSSTTRYFPCRN